MLSAKANRIVQVTVSFKPRPDDEVFKVFSGQDAVGLSRRFYRAKLKAKQSPRVVGAKKECEMTAEYTETVAVKMGYALKFDDSAYVLRLNENSDAAVRVARIRVERLERKPLQDDPMTGFPSFTLFHNGVEIGGG